MDGVSTLPLPGRPLISDGISAIAPAADARPESIRTRSVSDTESRWANFLVGPENVLLKDALNDVMQARVGVYNPLVLYGPAGVGKSHLARGLAIAWRRREATAEILCQHASEFITAYVAAAQHVGQTFQPDASSKVRLESPSYEAPELPKSFAAFRKPYKKLQLWVLEDLGVLADKPGTQQELMRLLDDLMARGGQFVTTLPSTPQSLDGLLPALRGRLSGGLAVPVARPSHTTRLAILRELALDRGIAMPLDVAEVLAAGLPATARELAGALLFLETTSRLDGRTMTVLDAEAYLAQQRGPALPELSKIAATVARFFAIKAAELKSPSRRQSVVQARGVAMFLAREITGKSLQRVGRYFGGRDHSTVLHACRKTSAAIEQDVDVANTVAELRRRLVGS